jgi:DNA modification methylase
MQIEANEITIVPVKSLKHYSRNRNKHSPEQIDRLAKLISHHGMRDPMTVDVDTNEVITGNGTLMACRQLKMKDVPVILQKFKNDEERYSFSVSHNAVASWAELDFSGINLDIGDFGPDFDLELLGLKDFRVDVADKEALCDEDEVPEHVEPKTKLGDLYILGDHRLLCGDSTVLNDLEKLMGEERADLVFTDPPYGVNYDGGHAEKGKRREKLANDDSTEIYTGSVPMMAMFSKEKAALYLWFAATKSLQVLQVLQDNNYEIRSWLIWNKNMAQFGAIGAQYKQKHEPCLYAYKKGNAPFWDGPNNEVSVWDEKRSSKKEFHPTQKPVELSKRAIVNSCPKNGIVLDLFGGSGSTMIGAEALNRKARLMELSPAYCDVIVARWEKYTGKKAVLESKTYEA